ncbi:ABC transporter substrate-binding protein [Streptomyces sp. 3MP-14]|uniref:ABC transporter substrate-binding protein n=1 Tax=Streptomyces mimosae TaxID=2586635 RepID=A0A5N6ACA5_9ACTN|nr:MULTISPECIES: ABC transporter substrate-binding protein [Streptomyces]KAB8165138.1 ABC transporter substrate-binding protein [Streptomyces mimosae]KAB8175770.1 ABC transporter substrate-binding protein [Streptomyces sp. 3MP-14]
MSKRTTRRARLAGAAVALTGALLLSACSSGGGGGGEENGSGGGGTEAETLEAISFADAEASTGPAEEVPGATPGGTVRVLQEVSPAHLDPGQVYVSAESNIAKLMHRGLTAVRMDNEGNYSIVGDLATDSGTVSEDGRSWTYTLKDDIYFSDGTPITSADVRHTIERTFAPFITNGPTFVQQWLANTGGADYRELLPDGPYEGDHLPDSILETPDDRTVVFHFEEPQTDLPYALAMVGYAMVSEEGDTREAYDQEPLATGPYVIESFRPDRSMTLVRNEHWDPATDPARNAYPDRFEITFGHTTDDSTQRLMADNGDDRYAITFNNGVDPGNAPEVASNPDYQERLVQGYQPYVATLAINAERVTDLRVRQAIAYALPLNGVLNAYGGAFGGEYAGGLISPLLPGYEEGYDPYGKLANPQGDPERARELLEEADAVGYELNYVHHTGTEDARAAVTVEDALEEAGFVVNRSDVPQTTYYDTIGVVDNGYDLYRSNWGHDWLSSATVIPPQFDGRQIQDGANNYSHVNDERINSEIDRIRQITDPAEAATEWFELNKYIVEDVLTQVPLYYYKMNILHGSLIGGAEFNDDIGSVDMHRIYVIQDEG